MLCRSETEERTNVDQTNLLKATALTGAGALLLSRRAWPFDQSPIGITKFSATLPGLGPSGANNYGNYIPVLSPDTKSFPGTDFYHIVVKQYTQRLHPAIPPTTFWGYADAETLDSRYLGGVVVAKRGTPVKLKVTNQMPPASILPVDPTLVDPTMLAETGGRTDRIAVHLHGAKIFWPSDGGPFHWYSNPANGGFIHGSSFINGPTKGPDVGSATYDHPSDQSARSLWYHDHAYALTRTNAYAGLATAYLVTDDAETLLVKTGLLPDLDGAFPLGIPLIIQDKLFWDGAGNDPNYNLVVPAGASKGSLWYPHVYEGPPLPSMTIPPLCDGTGRWETDGTPPPVSIVPEFFADTNLVNGAPYPTLPVDHRRYRFRILNGSQGRFYNLQMYVADASPDGITLKNSGELDNNGNPLLIPTNASGPRIIQIGTEGGFLPVPVVLNNPATPIGYKLSGPTGDPTLFNVNRHNLLMAVAERADIIVDFRDVPGGSQVVLYNDAPAPFPGGDIRNDYYGGDANLQCIGGAPSTTPGYGPDTRIIMKFVVGSKTVRELTFDETLAALNAALPITFLETQPPTNIRPTAQPKVKTLNEVFDKYGRLFQMLGAPEATEFSPCQRKLRVRERSSGGRSSTSPETHIPCTSTWSTSSLESGRPGHSMLTEHPFFRYRQFQALPVQRIQTNRAGRKQCG